jgi:hypothetical protein
MTFTNPTATQEAPVSDEYLSTSEAAQRLMVTTRTILHWIDLGFFPGSFKVNPRAKNSPYLIPVSAIENFEQERKEGKSAEDE